MTFASTFGRVLSPTFQPKSQAAAGAGGGWWDLNGTITSCIAAYQPKGAASYAASKTDLSGNSNTAADGAAYPAWDDTNGWKFTGSSKQYLTTGTTPANGYSLIVRYSDGNTGAAISQSLAGYHKTGARFRMDWIEGSGRTWASGGYKTGAGNATSGVMCVAGQTGYFDGSSKVTDISAWTDTADGVIWIGATNQLGRYTTCYIQAVAIYNATLTSTQVVLLSTAMAAL